MTQPYEPLLRPHDDLAQVKRRAKELFRAFRAGETEATALVNLHYREESAEKFKLSNAQLVMARASGFASWPKLKAFVEARMRARGKAVGAPYDGTVVRSQRPMQIGWVDPDGANDPAGGLEHTLGGTTAGGTTVDIPPSRVWFIEPWGDTPEAGWETVVDEIRQHRAPGLHARGRADDAAMRLIGQLEHLVYLDLGACAKITAEGLKHLAAMSKLEYLALRHMEGLTDEALAVLASLKNLRVLRLDENPQITDAGVTGLTSLDYLELVTLGGTACGDDALRILSGKSELANLTLGRNTTDAGLARLSGYPALRTWQDGRPTHKIDAYRGPDTGYLGIAGDRITDAGLVHLEQLSAVTKLALDNFTDRSRLVSDAGCVHITRMARIEGFELPGRLITDRFVAGIKDMPRITELSLWDAAAKEAGLKELARAEQITKLRLGRYHNLTPRGLGALARMPNLTEISIGSRNLPDDGLACLKDFHALRNFGTANENIFTDEAFRYIARIPNLEGLTNMYCRQKGPDGKFVWTTGDRSTEYLSEHATKLRRYHIWASNITDRSLKLLAGRSTIESLLFYRCDRITDAGIRGLAALSRLDAIDLQVNAKLTRAALTAFDRSVRINYQQSTAASEATT